MATVLSAANVEHLTFGYRNRTITAIAVCFPLAIFAVILRFTARKIARAGIWYDDWLSCAGLVGLGVFISLVLVDLPDDSAIRGDPIPESTLLANAKTVYVAELFYYITQFSLKLSILAFYWRLFNASSIRVPIYLVTAFCVAWFVASFLVTALQCVPVASLWTPALRSSAKCVRLAPFFFGTSIPNIVADLFLLALPMPYVWRLKISLTQRVFVMGFFLLGGFVLIASAIRLRLLLRIDMRSFYANWAVENSVLWSAIENCMAVVCVCLPSLRPIVRLLPCPTRLGKSLGSSDYTSGGDMRIASMENSVDKTKPQQRHIEHELPDWDGASCYVSAERAAEGQSITTADEESIIVQTEIQVSSVDVNRPTAIA
ncbi:hypothetical protein BU24DRAFT_457773 [Aaosphaeria arxii CBS 175.79]|uniref:Rhodopsin domain-containing protein n=1 Tax=Aaosphaeria arxii CBS 175.79 TaxID=1450172 RepID=A0A6A5Y9A9_9PLEO|nr:uncharacterized protein BU24DRAFT_457773 [Aaosphaeria arxii CBS 175.79]KAF2021846.1 hypothetical protein BU24DRAFT_457773 [Aaosphaeria arxii CBS 175.79]